MKNSPPKRSTSARIRQKRRSTRQEILRAAEEILVEEGVEGITLASVAGKLGLTKQALYHYFPSKEALVRGLTTVLLDAEVKAIISAIEKSGSPETALGDLIRTFHAHYIDNLDAFKSVYCQSQLQSSNGLILDEGTIRDEINPRTRKLFDLLEERICDDSMSAADRTEMRRLAFAAWLSSLGLVTMLSVAKTNNDPLIHSDEDLIATLTGVFDAAVSGRLRK